MFVNNEQPETEIVTSDLFHKRLDGRYSLCPFLKTLASSDRKKDQSFVIIGRESAKEESLPI